MTAFDESIYVFDLDGVITNPEDSSVDEAVIGYIRDILVQSGHVAVNTGRSYAWVQENFVQKLRALNASHAFGRLYIVCEKGGESRLWHDNTFVSQPSRFALPPHITQLAHSLFQEHQDELDTMFWDNTKQTMATIEKLPAADLNHFHRQQQKLAQWLQAELGGQEAKVDATTIATDVESPHAGKHAGAELIYEWVAQHTLVSHNTFTCFGDSISDYEMARYFAQQGAATTFVYVGKPVDIPDKESGVKPVITQALYAKGTREYLTKLFKADGAHQ